MTTNTTFTKTDLDHICNISYKVFESYNQRQYDRNIFIKDGLTLNYIKIQLLKNKSNLNVEKNHQNKVNLYIKCFNIIKDKLLQLETYYSSSCDIDESKQSLPYTQILNTIDKYNAYFDAPYKKLVVRETIDKIDDDIIKMSLDSKKELQSKLLVFYLESRYKILNNIIYNAYQIVTYLELQFDMHFEDDDLFDMLSFVERSLLIIRDE